MPEFTGSLRTPRLATAPASPALGEVYFNTGDNKLYWWNGTTWIDATGGGGGGGGATEIAIATGTPGGAETLWIDTDDPGGSPTLFVGTNQPGGSEVLWLDTDEDVRASIIPRVTSLPTAGLVDGQEVYYVADAVNGVLWHLRYNAGSASIYKWEYIGGPPMQTEVYFAGFYNVGTGAYGGQTSGSGVSPTLTLPLAGTYDLSAGVYITIPAAAAGASATVALKLGSAATDDAERVGNIIAPVAISATFAATVARSMRRTLATANSVIAMQYKANVAVNNMFMDRWINAIPQRVI